MFTQILSGTSDPNLIAEQTIVSNIIAEEYKKLIPRKQQNQKITRNGRTRCLTYGSIPAS